MSCCCLILQHLDTDVSSALPNFAHDVYYAAEVFGASHRVVTVSPLLHVGIITNPISPVVRKARTVFQPAPSGSLHPSLLASPLGPAYVISPAQGKLHNQNRKASAGGAHRQVIFAI